MASAKVTITNSKGSMTTAPRSFADYLAGKSTTTYTRPAKAKPTQKSVNKSFKSWGGTSNGIGVGM